MPRTSGRRTERDDMRRNRPAAEHRRGAPAAPATAPGDPRVRYGVLPLRLFLGATFVYAGMQKLTDSGFLNASGRTYIGRQLAGFAPHSPLGDVLRWLGDNLAVEVGVSVIATELVVGLAVLAGLWTRGFATVGALLSGLLFLSATWDVTPYFLGSDSVYAVAWVTLALVGDRGIWAPGRRLAGRLRGDRPPLQVDAARRALLVRVGGAAVGGVWLLGILPRGRSAPVVTSTAGLSPTGAPPTPSQASPGAGKAGPAVSPAATPRGTRIGTVAQLQSAGSISYQDPVSGDPAIAVAVSGQPVVAFDAVCPHAGCTVDYDPGQALLICPCHGAAFDPAHGAQVLQGPASSPLPPLAVTVASDGGIYAAGGS